MADNFATLICRLSRNSGGFKHPGTLRAYPACRIVLTSPRREHPVFWYKDRPVNEGQEKFMAVCSQTHTKHKNTVCGQNVELLNVKLTVHIVTTGL
jgi:hypothetical protein